jgi:hypothetical protein
MNSSSSRLLTADLCLRASRMMRVGLIEPASSSRTARNAAYVVAKAMEPDLDFQKFLPRFDAVMAELVAQVPADIQPWAR